MFSLRLCFWLQYALSLFAQLFAVSRLRQLLVKDI